MPGSFISANLPRLSPRKSQKTETNFDLSPTNALGISTKLRAASPDSFSRRTTEGFCRRLRTGNCQSVTLKGFHWPVPDQFHRKHQGNFSASREVDLTHFFVVFPGCFATYHLGLAARLCTLACLDWQKVGLLIRKVGCLRVIHDLVSSTSTFNL
jgi:hypothetical protein